MSSEFDSVGSEESEKPGSKRRGNQQSHICVDDEAVDDMVADPYDRLSGVLGGSIFENVPMST